MTVSIALSKVKESDGIGERLLVVKSTTALIEDLGLVLSTHVVAHNYL